MIHDFDPSGEDHDEACMCPCCDQVEGKLDEEGEENE